MARPARLGTGDRAPAFSLPTVNREGSVSLAEYHGRPLLLGLYRGLHCPFCRRHLAQLDLTREKLTDVGVETLAVVNTPVTAARLYFKHRPTRVLLASDPESATHRCAGAIARRTRGPAASVAFLARTRSSPPRAPLRPDALSG